MFCSSAARSRADCWSALSDPLTGRIGIQRAEPLVLGFEGVDRANSSLDYYLGIIITSFTREYTVSLDSVSTRSHRGSVQSPDLQVMIAGAEYYYRMRVCNDLPDRELLLS